VNNVRQTRRYYLNGVNLQISCSGALAPSLDGRFRYLPASQPDCETVYLDFQSVVEEDHHSIEKPSQQCGRTIYELAGGEVLYFAGSDELYLSFGKGVRAVANLRQGRAVFSIVDADPANIFMASHLLLTIVLVEMLKRHGLYSMHAAGFSKDGRAILISGTSGAGKSTLAVALLRGGLEYLSDDMVFLSRRSGQVQVLGFPEDVDVSDNTIGFFPELDFLLRIPNSGASRKKQLPPIETYGSELADSALPSAIVFPRISASETSTLRPIGADEALLELVSNVLLTEARVSQQHLNILTEVARQTRCYRLETGRDFERIPSLLGELLAATPKISPCGYLTTAPAAL
jgi:hypothetical protein